MNKSIERVKCPVCGAQEVLLDLNTGNLLCSSCHSALTADNNIIKSAKRELSVQEKLYWLMSKFADSEVTVYKHSIKKYFYIQVDNAIYDTYIVESAKSLDTVINKVYRKAKERKK